MNDPSYTLFPLDQLTISISWADSHMCTTIGSTTACEN